MVGQVGGLDAGPQVGGLVTGVGAALQLAQFLADGGHLLAQQELALLAVHALLHVLADGLRDVQLREVLSGPSDRQLEPADQVGGLQEGQLPLRAQVGRVAGGVRDRGRVGQPLDAVDQLPGAALLEHRHHEALVLAGQLLRALVRSDVGHDRDLNPEGAAGAGGPGADAGAGHPAHQRAGFTAGETADLFHDADRADGGVAAVQPAARAGPAPGLPRSRRRRRRVPRRH